MSNYTFDKEFIIKQAEKLGVKVRFNPDSQGIVINGKEYGVQELFTEVVEYLDNKEKNSSLSEYQITASIFKWNKSSKMWLGEFTYVIDKETWNTLVELEKNEEYTLHHELVEQYVLDCFMEYHMESNERIEDFEIEWYEIDLRA